MVSIFLFGELRLDVDGELQTVIEYSITTFEGFWHRGKSQQRNDYEEN